LVGGLIAKDKDFQVPVANFNEKKLDELTKETDIPGIKADLSSSEVIRVSVNFSGVVRRRLEKKKNSHNSNFLSW